MNTVSWFGDLLPALLADSFDVMVGLCLALAVLAWRRTKAVRFGLHLLTPAVITLGAYQLIPAGFYGHSPWFLVGLFAAAGLCAPWRWLPAPVQKDLPRLFAALAFGVFILRVGFWGYLLFNAALDENPGSFRLKGVVWAERQAQAWRFSALQSLTHRHWIYPSERQRYIKPYPENAEALFAQGLREAETFRRELLAPSSNGVMPAQLIAQAITAFQQQSRRALQGRPNLEGFNFSEQALIEGLKGRPYQISDEAVFQPYMGKWYGEWEGSPVDHEWRHVEYFNPAKRFKGMSIGVTHLQYAWVGDGFGWNVIAQALEEDQPLDIVLGTVYHIKNSEMSQITMRRPHVGIAGGSAEPNNKIIWITKHKMFFEEVFPAYYKSEEKYIITGFAYERTERTLNSAGQAFQAIYTRLPRQRPNYYKFTLDLDIQID